MVRLNALRHGLLGGDVVLPGEDADAFEELWNGVRADLSPVGPIEELLTDRVINALWRLQCLARAEIALFHWRAHVLKAHQLAEEGRILRGGLLRTLWPPSLQRSRTKPCTRRQWRRSGGRNASGTGTNS